MTLQITINSTVYRMDGAALAEKVVYKKTINENGVLKGMNDVILNYLNNPNDLITDAKAILTWQEVRSISRVYVPTDDTQWASNPLSVV